MTMDMAQEHPGSKQPQSDATTLLQLPLDCLVKVLRFCAADDQCSVFTAARAHSRLHQAAPKALHRIAAVVSSQQHADSILHWLGKYGQAVNELVLTCQRRVCLRQLPSALQPNSLELDMFSLQLQPGGGFKGVLGSGQGAALKQLRLTDNNLCDDSALEALSATLMQLPAGLEHLSYRQPDTWAASGTLQQLPTAVLHHLQHLTYLELAQIELQGSEDGNPPQQALSALTGLVDLRLDRVEVVGTDFTLHADSEAASFMRHLTRLDVLGERYASHESLQLDAQRELVILAPSALANMLLLQHLDVPFDNVYYDDGRLVEGLQQFMSCLQQLQQLTYLNLRDSFDLEDESPPAAAFSALTASSRLQHLDIHECMLPEGVWQHMFPVGWPPGQMPLQSRLVWLPHLQSLDLSNVIFPDGRQATAPEGSHLASCCPNLQTLRMQRLRCSTQVLGPLTGLSRLHTLYFSPDHGTNMQVVEALHSACQLSQLREMGLSCYIPSEPEGLLLQLTQMSRLTSLNTWGIPFNGPGAHDSSLSLSCQTPVDEPVWRQLLGLHLNSRDSGVAQEAAAVLRLLELAQ